MLCEKCQKREATIMVTEIMNGRKREMRLCSQCAAQLRTGMGEEFSLSRLLSGILGGYLQADEPNQIDAEKITCPGCGMTYGEFVRDSQFGCADCYNTFGLLIEQNLKRIQISSRHTGKKPKYQKHGVSFEETVEQIQKEENRTEQLRLLQARLQEALQEEEYEQAALLRDEIHALKAELEQK